MKYDKDKIKNSLTIEQVMDLVAELGGEPKWDNVHNAFISRTICHNGDSHKLWYYANTTLFKCFTHCSSTFDIFELVCKVKSAAGEEWPLPKAIEYVAQYFGFAPVDEKFSNEQTQLQDWQVLNKYERINSVNSNETQTVEFKEYNEDILRYLPHPRILPWEEEGITREVMEARGICFNPMNQGIVIPHYDKDGKLVGIRERTLIKEEEKYGKYKPIILNGKMYNHPLGFNLYNLNHSKDNIAQMQKVIIFEGEKSCLLYASLFGLDNDISVACCGSSLISHQVQLLIDAGARELIVAFDKQFQELGDEEHKTWVKKLKDIHKKYSAFIDISFMFDTNNLLGYKDSPIDRGEKIFLELFKERVRL